MTIDEINIPQATAFEFQLTAQATGQTYPLNDEMLIGRELDCTIRVDAPQIRRYHAKVSVSDDGLFLEDLNAKNNTYLNGCRIGNGAWITLGDEINFDGIKFSVEPVKASPSDTSAAELKAALDERAPTRSSAEPMPFSNQDVVEATRALEERAKARLQHFKQNEEAGLSPNWQKFVANKLPTETVAPLAPPPPKPKARATVTPIRPKSTVVEDFEDSSLSENDLEASMSAIDDALSSKDTPKDSPLDAPKSIEETAEVINELQEEPITEEVVEVHDALEPLNAAETQAEIEEIDLGAHQEFKPAKATKTAEAGSEFAEPSALEATPDEAQVDNEAVSQSNEEIAEPVVQPKAKRAKAVSAGSGPRLLAQTAPIRGKCYQLAATDAKKAWTIGRASNADVQLSEEGIDLIHAHVEQGEQGFKIRTTRTTNGMLVNGKFKSEALLQHGDSIHFGRIEFTFRDDVDAPATPQNTKKSGINYGTLVGGLVVLGALLAALLSQQ